MAICERSSGMVRRIAVWCGALQNGVAHCGMVRRIDCALIAEWCGALRAHESVWRIHVWHVQAEFKEESHISPILRSVSVHAHAVGILRT